MAAEVNLKFRRRPSVFAYHLRALHPSPGVRGEGTTVPIRATWTRHRIDRQQLAQFLALTGLRAEHGLPMLFPHVLGFPLQMVLLTHPRFPVPIWRILQVRNHLVQHRPIATDAILDMETVMAGQRILEKGVEFDLQTRISEGTELVWESVNTFFARGRYGQSSAVPPSVRMPVQGHTMAARWTTTTRSGWRFAALSGDYNGIHYWSWYARRMGFQRALLHSQLVLGQCMARLDVRRTTGSERLDTWLRGPVYQGADVHLLVSATEQGTDFQLIPDGERRSAIVGRWQ